MQVSVFSGGAAQGLVNALAVQFRALTGCEIAGTFGAVGAMRDKLLAGTPADLLILTRALVAELERTGYVVPGSAVDLGIVRTGVAIRAGETVPRVSDAASLRSALMAASGIYFPDPKLATAGIHFAKVLGVLGITGEVDGRLRPYPNGAAAMEALAQATDARVIGCTQVTEILNTPGVTLVGPLPKEFELATVYTAGVSSRATSPAQAQQLAALLGGVRTKTVRAQAGFEPVV